MANTYKAGTSVKLTAIFQDVDADPFDPDEVICSVQSPSQAAADPKEETAYTYQTDAALVRDEVGVYHLWVVNPDEEGTWTYGFKGDGDAAVTNCGEFEIESCGLAFE